MRIPQIFKRLARSTLRRFGYELTKKVDAAAPRSYPFLEHYSLSYRNSAVPCQFDFWICNRDAEQWYKEWFHAADNPVWELDEFSWLLAPGDRVLEIGCHHGFLTMMLLHCVGETGFVYAIDALPENALITQAQISLNRVGDRCMAQNLAAGARKGVLHFARTTNTHAILTNDANSIEVEVTTGDALDQLHGPFNVLKLDVEGYEGHVLEGCAQLLKRRPKLVLELHPDFMKDYGYGTTIEEVLCKCNALGYEGTIIVRPNFAKRIPFSLAAVPLHAVSNLHLRQKS